MIHLDTGFLIQALARGSREDRRLRTWLGESTPLGMSAVSWAELLCGPVTEEDIALVRDIVGEPVVFTAADAALAAHLFNRGGRRRGTLADCMIAATAIRSGAALATTNPADFKKFSGAGLELAR